MEGSFWPIAHHIKERQLSNRNHGSDCNKKSDIDEREVPASIEFTVTACERQVPTPVEFMVTACHATRGSGSSKINIAEEGALRVEEFGVTAFHQNCGGTNHVINVLEQKTHSSVGFTVTACHAMRGSGSSEINIEEKDALRVEEFGVTAFHQNRGGTNHVINVTEQKALSLDEFTVTACHALRGSGSSETTSWNGEPFFQCIAMIRLCTNVSAQSPRTTSQNEVSNTFTSPQKQCQAYVSLPHTRGL
jgi:hypothetical protein